MKTIIGVDEAGRGPLAGPVTVACFESNSKNSKLLLKVIGGKLKDSKQLSEHQRENIYKKFLELKKQSIIDFKVAHIGSSLIDKWGINKSIILGIKRIFNKKNPLESSVRLDGLLKAPDRFEKQKTIIKGDEKDIFIACASIVAKVSRDRLMGKISKKYPKYGLHIHKGYGTFKHRELIKINGLSAVHRKTYCKAFA